MKLFEAIKIFGILLMVAIVISFFGCGEDEETPVRPATSNSNPVTVEQTGGNPPGPPAEIVWIEIDDKGNHIEKKKIEYSNSIQGQNVVVAKVKDAKGDPVPDVRVEWILNTRNGAVGDIVETDDPGHRDVPAAPVLGAVPQVKVDNKFAFTFTNSTDETPPQLKGLGPNKTNITIQKGETWIVITSVAEGDTDFTAFAPAIPRDGEHPHKIFGVEHWRDLKWEFPDKYPTYKEENTINYCEGGVNEHTYVTKLIKVSNPNEVVPGVKVRYTIQPGGPDAIWKENSEKVYEATSDKNGEAKATIKLRTLGIGKNNVLVEIVPLKGLKEITKKWLGPSLTITKKGPDSICLLGDASYSITVTNVGDATATKISVTDTFDPKGFEFVDASSGCTPAGGKVTCDIGDLKPGESKTIVVTLKGKNIGSYENTAKTESAECAKAGPISWTTVVGSPEISITKAGPPIIGLLDEAEYKITVTNTSECQATEVEIADIIDSSAFTFVAASDGGNYANGKVTWPPVSSLPAGTNKTVTVMLKAIKDGKGENTATVQCAEGKRLDLPPKTFEFETTVVAPELQVACEFTSESIKFTSESIKSDGFAKPGEEITKYITITNVSRIAASLNGRKIPEARGIAVTDDYPEDLLRFVSDSDGGVGNGGQVIWRDLGKLGPLESKTITVTFSAKSSDEIRWNGELCVSGIDDISVTSNEGRINPIGNAEGQCEIKICGPLLEIVCAPQGFKDKIMWSETTVFPLEVSNVGSVSATNLELKLSLTKGVTLEEFQIPEEAPSISDDGTPDPSTHTVTWKLDSLAPQKTWPVQVKLIGIDVDKDLLKATVTCAEGSEDDCESQLTVIPPLIDLEKTRDIDPIIIGNPEKDTVTYTIKITNKSEVPLRFVKLVDEVPKVDIDRKAVSMIIVGVDSNRPFNKKDNDTIADFDIGEMLPGEVVVIKLKVKAVVISAEVALVNNTATLYMRLLDWDKRVPQDKRITGREVNNTIIGP